MKIENLYPLTPLQHGILFHSLLQPRGGMYWSQLGVTIEGELDAARFREAWDQVLRRHEVLRTVFVWEKRDRPLQAVLQEPSAPWTELDWSRLSAGEQAEKLARYLEDDRANPCDLAHGPLVRLALIRLAPARHRFIFSAHHILLDGWSTPIVLGEVLDHYEASLVGRSSRAPSATPFKQYVEWLLRQDLAPAREFFTTYLAGFRSATQLPAQGLVEQPCELREGYASETLCPSGATLGALRQFARERRLTLNTLVQAAWGILLSRYSAESDVLFGITLSGRSAPVTGIESMIGLLINTLPLRLQVRPERRVSDWLREVQATQADLQRFEHTALIEAQGASEIPRDRPLFESLVVFENYPTPARGNDPASVTLGEIQAHERGSYPLTLVASARETLELQLAYDTQRFTRATARRLLEQIEKLLRQLPMRAEEPIGRLEVTTDEEARRLTQEWSAGEPMDFERAPAHVQFERQAGARPDATALCFENESLTYRELDARANCLAQRLRKLGIGAETRVAVAMERSIEAIVAILGILKAGGAYVPLDPRYPRARLTYMLRDAQCALLLTQEALRDTVACEETPTLCLDTAWHEIEQESAHAPDERAQPHHLAYVIYTSGSTGEPKGVALEHAGLSNLVGWMRRGFAIEPTSRVLQFASLSFDASVSEIFMALSHGATLILARQEVLAGPDLEDCLRSERISHVTLPPTLLALLTPEKLPDLRVIVSAGEACPVEVARRWAGACTLINGYGPTEATVCASSHVCRSDDPRTPPIGRPIANVYWRILDDNSQLAPVGAAGELHLGGAGLARGYLNRPELTDARFIADPLAPGRRLYKTGDLARLRADGCVEFLGRIDQQVKLRGFRIELNEIETQLRRLDRVRDAVVLLREDLPGRKQLVAYVMPRTPASAPEPQELRTLLRAQLPEHMVPAAFVMLEKLPLTLNGKLDRAALPAPGQDSEVSTGATAPRSPIEETLWDIWRDVLKVSRPGIHDSFFDLGGHSLLATQAISRIRGVFALDLPLRALFEYPTIAALAAHIKDLAARTPQHDDTISRAPDGLPAPLSAAQLGIWLVEKLGNAGVAYNMTWTARLTGHLDASTLTRSLEALVDRHEILRTRFEERDGEPRQIVAATVPFRVEHLSLENVHHKGRESALEQHLEEWRRTPFDLTRAPLFAARLLRLSPHEHVLSLAIHHILCDGWSLGVIARELQALYRAFGAGAAPPAPPSLQFKDYALWEQRRLGTAVLGKNLEYWRKQLRDLEVLHLPADRPRGTESTSAAGLEQIRLPPELTQALRALARRENATLYMVLTAALKVLLARWSGQTDIAIGTPAVGRDRPELEHLIGCLLNTLVLRTDLSGNPNFKALLARVRETALAAYAHQDMPFDRLVAELKPARDLNGNPFFDVMINYTEGLHGNFDLPELSGEVLASGSPRAKFDLTLYVNSHAQDTELSLVYRSELFAAPRMRAFLDQLGGLLGQIAKAPDRSIFDYSLITDSSRAILPDPLVAIEAPAQIPVVQQFWDWARREPQRVALRTTAAGMPGELTYGELAMRAGALADTLKGLRLGRGDTVAIVGERGAALIAAMLGVLASGAAFLIVEAALPLKRRALMLREAQAKALIGTRSLREAADEPTGAAPIPFVHLDMDGPAAPAADTELAWPAESDPAYIFFTSGSTGHPKAVLGCHRGLSHFIRWQRETFEVGAADRVSQLIGLSFDPLLRDVFLPLTTGATLCIPREEDRLDPLSWIARERVSTVHTTPTLLQNWLSQSAENLDLDSLRLIFVAGEPLTGALIEHWRRRFGSGARIVNLYGPTETTLAKCYYIVPPEPNPGVQPLGKAMPGSQVLLLNTQGRQCGIGETGEIVLRTPFRSLGYLNDARGNASAFRPNPLREDSTDIVYFSGDLARYRPDGLLEFAGRQDDQVKINGVRVEPAEITATLAQHPQVEACIVMARAHDSGRQRLIAYVQPRPAMPLAATELRAWLETRLPAAFVPATYVLLAALPLLPNGKIDRKSLPSPLEGAEHKAQDSAPRSALERTLQDSWAKLLGIDPPGIHSDFFDLGGHSLLATQLVSRIRQLLGVELPLRALFEHRTIASLAAHIENRAADLRISTAIRKAIIEIQPRDRALPLSFSQQRMWFVQQREPQGTAYNMPFAVRLKGALQIATLKRVLAQLIERHEAFRTTFAVIDGVPAQRITPHVALEILETDLRELVPEAAVTEAARLFGELALQPFDLTRAPLCRIACARLGETDHALVWIIHHTIGDQWSAGILWDELAALYAAATRGETLELDPLPVQYADFAVWQRRHWSGERLQSQLAYWKERLKDLPPLALPTDRARPAHPTFRGSRVGTSLAPRTLKAIKQLSTLCDATPFMTLLACFKLLLARYCNQEDLAVGTPIANRTRIETEKLVGTLVNTLVMRTDLSGDLTFAQLLSRVRAGALDAFAHQDLPFERLVEELVRGRDAGQTPIVQVLFNVPNAPVRAFTLGGLEIGAFEFDRGSSQFDLALSVDTERTGRLNLAYSTELFECATAQRLLEQYVELIEQVLVDPHRPISSYRLVGEQDRQQLLDEWNRTECDYPQGRRADQLIAEQAARTPDAIALGMGSQQLTYAELDGAANQLARHLQSQGADTGSRIGVCLERSPQMVIALLAIMKSGGTYVPLDPGFPIERLRFMAEDADLILVLTESRVLEKLGELGARSLCLERYASEIARQSRQAPDSGASMADLAYILYTSGSTGKPKGVEIPHGALTNFLCSMRQTLACGAGDRLLAVTTLSFDICGLELYLPLVCAARVEIASRAEAMDGRLLIQRLKQCQATFMQATPTTWRMLIEAGWRGSRHLTALCGGEALPQDLAEKLLSRCKTLWNLYGPTETTIWSTAARIEKGTAVTIGRPIANTSLYILDKALQPVPIGVAGELYIGGHGLARGYRNRPELTRERFIAHPFSGDPAGRLYRTGDLARYLPDGRVVHLGRVDFQVKIRGYRIEPQEVEAALLAQPGIEQAVVVAQDDGHGSPALVAYLIRAEGSTEPTPPPAALQAALRKSLPAYMIPAHFVWLKSFALTANRKIDLKALPIPSAGKIAAFAAPVAPRGRLEVQLTALFRQVLGDDSIGIRDNFFDRGGHSLTAVQLLSQIERITSRELPLATLFEAPTIEELARVLARSNWQPSWRSLVAIQPVGSGTPLFAIPGVGGNVLMFAKLARLLGNEQPFYGLQARGLDSAEEPFTSIGKMAAHYIREIRSIRPKGPYWIAGACTGGVVAYEMAAQLRAQGESVSLVLIESWHPSSARKPLFTGKLLAPLHYVWAKITGGVYQDRVTRATWHAVAHYRPKALSGGLLHVIAAKRLIGPRVRDTRRMWENLAADGAQVTFLDAPDSGQMFFSPHVEELAARLRDYL